MPMSSSAAIAISATTACVSQLQMPRSTFSFTRPVNHARRGGGRIFSEFWDYALHKYLPGASADSAEERRLNSFICENLRPLRIKIPVLFQRHNPTEFCRRGRIGCVLTAESWRMEGAWERRLAAGFGDSAISDMRIVKAGHRPALRPLAGLSATR